MEVELLLEKLKKDNIIITIVDEHLKVHHKDGRDIDEAVIATIRNNKSAIIGFIRQSARIASVKKQELYPVSHAQKRLLLLAEFEEPLVAYNSFGSKLLKGPLDLERLKKAYMALIDRHEMLRTIFVMRKGEYWQQVLPGAAELFEMTYIDMQSRPDADLQAYCRQMAAAVFDLKQLPLIRTTVIQKDREEFVFLFVIHHIICDGWSLKVFFSEMMQLYNQTADLPPVAIQYKDYSDWHNRLLDTPGHINPHRDYWLSKFSEPFGPLTSLTEYRRPAVKTYNGSKLKKIIPVELYRGIRRVSSRYGVSPFVWLLAGVKCLLFRYTGEEDIVIGTSVAGRDHLDLEGQIGFFVNTLALRTIVSRKDNFAGLVTRTGVTVMEALEHQVYPFDLLVEELNIPMDRSRSPLFDVKVVFQNTEDLQTLRNVSLPGKLEGIEVEDFETAHQVSIYDLSLRFTEHRDTLITEIEYNTDLFGRHRIEQLYAHFICLQEKVISDPTVPLTGISFKEADYDEPSEHT